MKNDKEQLVEKFEAEFNKLKKELKFKTTLKELDKVFFLSDFFAERGYISQDISRSVCRRIVDLLMSWYNYLNTLIMPNTGYMANMVESQMFNESEKEEIMQTMNKIIAFTSQNTLNVLKREKKADAKFLDNSIKLWDEIIPPLVKVMSKVANGWDEKSRGITKKKMPDKTVF